MRWVGFTILGMLLGGCASQPQAASVAPEQQPVKRYYAPASGVALAFDPPVLAGSPRLDLSREGREPAAFEGFSEASTQYYSLTVDDWYSDFNGGFGGGGRNSSGPDNYSRRAVTQMFGITIR